MGPCARDTKIVYFFFGGEWGGAFSSGGGGKKVWGDGTSKFFVYKISLKNPKKFPPAAGGQGRIY